MMKQHLDQKKEASWVVFSTKQVCGWGTVSFHMINIRSICLLQYWRGWTSNTRFTCLSFLVHTSPPKNTSVSTKGGFPPRRNPLHPGGLRSATWHFYLDDFGSLATYEEMGFKARNAEILFIKLLFICDVGNLLKGNVQGSFVWR